MQRDHARVTVTAASTVLAAVVPGLLTRMRADFDATGRLSDATMAGMYAAYGVHAGAVAVAARHRLGLLSIRSRTIERIGTVCAGAGVALTAAGMSGFGSARQLSGGSHPQLATVGVYALSRNPQYVGGIAALAGLSVMRRSLVVAGLAVGYAVVIRVWVPIEEATLERLFGDVYRRYCQRVPRWIGRHRERDR